MRNACSKLPVATRLTQLAVCLASIHGVDYEALAGTVTNCGDGGGATTLRGVVAAAASGEQIDVTACAGSTITLTAGQIAFNKPNFVVVNHSTTLATTISGHHNGRVFHHSGTGGFIEFTRINLIDGAITGPGVYGGCLYTTAAVINLDHVTIQGCSATATVGVGKGGGIYGKHLLNLLDSVVSGNTVYQTSSNHFSALGGGIFVDTMHAYNSTITNNAAKSTTIANSANKYTRGGGVYAVHGANVFSSTISYNYAGLDAGGLLLNASSGSSATIANSTVSNNTAVKSAGGIGVGGLGVIVGPLTLANSTVAFNSAFLTTGTAGVYVGGTLTLQSSIIANNTFNNGTESDLMLGLLGGQIDAASANNLIITSNLALPADTIQEPARLLPLADNGGKTKTHALDQGSPALNRGNVTYNLPGFIPITCDQRGNPTKSESNPPNTDHCDTINGGFLRIDSDPKHSKPDIGAYEEQLPNPDWIFFDGFGF